MLQLKAIKQEIKILLEDWQDRSTSHSNIDWCSTPKKIYSGLSLLQASKIIAPLAKSKIFKDDNEWQGIYDQLDYANKPYFITEQKVGIWFQSTKGLTAIDIDSAGSKQSPSKLMTTHCRDCFRSNKITSIIRSIISGYASFIKS